MSLNDAPPIQVEVRKKGLLGSISETRPSLKVRLADPIEGLKRLTLNNNQQDKSQVAQCVAYRAFARAGVPAPRCSLAHVVVNGVSLGVYSNVESIKKPFLHRIFGDDGGRLYEGSISDFRPAWDNTIQKKSDTKNPERADVVALTQALSSSDEELLAKLDPLLDVDAFLTFWIMERLIGHWDGYANNQNNFYFYRRPDNGKIQFIPWGADSVLGAPDLLSRVDAPPSLYANSQLPRRLYALPTIRAHYAARMREVLESWDPTEMQAEIATLEKLARPHLHISENAFDAGLAVARSYIEGRRKVIEADMAQGPVAWASAPRSSPCGVKAGTVTASFEAAWEDTQPLNPMGRGKSDLVVELGGAEQTFQMGGVTATATEESQNKPTVGFFGMRDGGKLLMVFASINAQDFKPASKLNIDGKRVTGIVLEFEMATGKVKIAGFLAGGTIELDKAGTNDGDIVSGKISANINQPGYWSDPPTPATR